MIGWWPFCNDADVVPSDFFFFVMKNCNDRFIMETRLKNDHYTFLGWWPFCNDRHFWPSDFFLFCNDRKTFVFPFVGVVAFL